MLVVWGRKNSINVQKVLWCCEELGMPYERREAGGAFGVVNTPEYRRLNPNGLIPTIEDDGFVLWESNVIVRYLARKSGSGALLPADARQAALADQWMDWHVSTFWPAIRVLFLGLVRTPVEQRDNAALEASRKSTLDALRIVDAWLQDRAYLAGDAFSMADIPLGAGVWRWMALPIERPELANVKRWFDALAKRRAYAEIVMQPLS